MATKLETPEESFTTDMSLVSIRRRQLPKAKGVGCCRGKVSEIGALCDLMADFQKHRGSVVKRKNAESATELRKPLCAQKASAMKCKALEEEMHKLVDEYQENSGRMRGLMLELKTWPSSQTLPQWVEPSKATNCFKCNRRFRAFTQKINCRVGGQVFCSDCSSDLVVLYKTEEGDTKWAVNGKPGGPSATPNTYILLPVCCDCSEDLQTIVLRKLSDDTRNSTKFLEQLHNLHRIISTLEMSIDAILPRYLKVVNSLNMEDDSPTCVDEQNPLQYVAKTQPDLLEIFSLLEMYTKKVNRLETGSETEKKLREKFLHVRGTKFDSDKAKFQLAKNQLAEIMPAQDLEKIQRNVRERIISKAQMHVERLKLEVTCQQQIHGFNSGFIELLVAIIANIEREYQPLSNVSDTTTDLTVSEESLRLISIDPQVTDPKSVRYIIISQVSSKLREDYEQLREKTVCREFPKTKECFHQALEELDSLLTVT